MKILGHFVSRIHRQRGHSCIVVFQSICLDINRQYQNRMEEVKLQNFYFVASDMSVVFAGMFYHYLPS